MNAERERHLHDCAPQKLNAERLNNIEVCVINYISHVVRDVYFFEFLFLVVDCHKTLGFAVILVPARLKCFF